MPDLKRKSTSQTPSTNSSSKAEETEGTEQTKGTKKLKVLRATDIKHDQSFRVLGRVKMANGVYSFEGDGYSLKSVDTGEPILQNLRMIDKGTDEHAAIIDKMNKQQSLPRYFDGAEPIYLDADGGLYFDTQRAYVLKNSASSAQPAEVYFDGDDLEENSGYYFYQLLLPESPADDARGQLLYFKVIFIGEGGGFGSARSDVPGDYRWFGNQALGYALKLNMENWGGDAR